MALITDLVAYYSMNGNSSDDVSANDGSDSNITYSTGNGIIPQGAGFNGSSSNIGFGNVLSGTGDFSIQFWLKTTQTGAASVPLAQRSNVTVDGQIMFFLNGQGSSSQDVTAYIHSNSLGDSFYMPTLSVNMCDGNWHQFVFTLTSGVGRIYVDGVLNNSATPGFIVPLNAAIPMNMGCDIRGLAPGSPANWYNGALDEIGFWTRALSGTEVGQLYNSGAALAYPLTLPSGPVNVKSVNGLTLHSA
jgi:hypothetical protein